MDKTILITGATGFIGRVLSRALLAKGYGVRALTRNARLARRVLSPAVEPVEWSGRDDGSLVEAVEAVHGVINLAGENIAGRWTEAKKERIRTSRLAAGQALSTAIRLADLRPLVLIQASAVGVYGHTGDSVLDERSAPGTGFMAATAGEWEASTEGVRALGVRHVVLRSGIVLAPQGGVLGSMLTPFHLFVGGRLGSGSQWMSWIHMEDEVRAVLFLLEGDGRDGAYNLTAPHPETMATFARTLGRVMARPARLPVPRFALRLLLGELADDVLLASQRVRPERLLEAGFTFLHPGLEGALQAALTPSPGESWL